MSELTDFRVAKDEYFGGDHHSPLTAEQQQGFDGLHYFEENEALALVVAPEELDDGEVVEVQTSTGDVARYTRWARISFDVDGERASLTLFKDAEEDDSELFLPFADGTSGKEAFGAGRYLEVRQLHDGSLLVDFNYAYNPYCAYNEGWSCPLTPFENRIAPAIRAGETNFK